MTTEAQRDRAEAIDRLRQYIDPGDTLYTVLRHRSASGMLRVIDVLKIDNDPDRGRPNVYHLSYNTARAIDMRTDNDRDGIRVSGAGMDMGYHIVYNLSRALWPDGFECIGDRCPSNDHTNGDRDYTPHHHNDGGYALRHEWL